MESRIQRYDALSFCGFFCWISAWNEQAAGFMKLEIFVYTCYHFPSVPKTILNSKHDGYFANVYERCIKFMRALNI